VAMARQIIPITNQTPPTTLATLSRFHHMMPQQTAPRPGAGSALLRSPGRRADRTHRSQFVLQTVMCDFLCFQSHPRVRSHDFVYFRAFLPVRASGP
jgi:hypothetical protein